MRHSIYRLNMHRKWTALTLAVGILFIVLTTLTYKVFKIAEVTQATFDYRLTGLLIFAVIWIAIYIHYRFFPRDYYVTRHFNSSPFFHVLLSSVIYTGVIVIIMMVMALLKPLNTHTTWIGVGFYSVMSLLFIVILSNLLGLIYVLYPKLSRIFAIVVIITFCLLPILYIPTSNNGWLTHLMMLNPMYYLVNGMQQSIIVGREAMNHLGYHFYFICFIGLMTVFCFALKDYVSQLRPNEHHQPDKDES
ncbi:teichoic acid translocation permease [Staphylococcus lutrae]|nr:teichoic acid translocation permease [Staphylococcus lutrae]